MSLTDHRNPMGLIALAAAGSMVLLAAAPASALATHASRHQPAPAAKAHRFTAEGLVVSSTGSSVVVLARDVSSRGRVDHNKLITVAVAPRHQRHLRGASTAGPSAGTLIVGNLVDLSGTATSSGTTATFTATQVVQHTEPAHVFLGTVTAVNANLVTVTKAATASDDQGENSDGSNQFTVDVTNAAVTVDGAAGSLTVGQSVAVLGEGVHDLVLAAAVYAFTAVPTVLAGDVSAVNGTLVTIGDSGDGATVDLAGVPLSVNGNPDSTTAALDADTNIVVLGSTDTAGTLTPTLAFAFNSADRNPAGANPDD